MHAAEPTPLSAAFRPVRHRYRTLGGAFQVTPPDDPDPPTGDDPDFAKVEFLLGVNGSQGDGATSNFRDVSQYGPTDCAETNGALVEDGSSAGSPGAPPTGTLGLRTAPETEGPRWFNVPSDGSGNGHYNTQQPFCIEGWVGNLTTLRDDVFAIRFGTTLWYFLRIDSNETLIGGFRHSTGLTLQATTGTIPATGAATHVYFGYSGGQAGNIYLAIDGVMEVVALSNISPFVSGGNQPNEIYLGPEEVSASASIHLFDFRFTLGKNRETASFTPPTDPYPTTGPHAALPTVPSSLKWGFGPPEILPREDVSPVEVAAVVDGTRQYGAPFGVLGSVVRGPNGGILRPGGDSSTFIFSFDAPSTLLAVGSGETQNLALRCILDVDAQGTLVGTQSSTHFAGIWNSGDAANGWNAGGSSVTRVRIGSNTIDAAGSSRQDLYNFLNTNAFGQDVVIHLEGYSASLQTRPLFYPSNGAQFNAAGELLGVAFYGLTSEQSQVEEFLNR